MTRGCQVVFQAVDAMEKSYLCSCNGFTSVHQQYLIVSTLQAALPQ